MIDSMHTQTGQLPSLPIPLPQLLDNVQTGVVVLDKEWRFLFVNQWFSDKVGQSVDRLLQSSLDNLLTEECRTETRRALSILFDWGENTSWQATLCVEQDKEVPAEFFATPIRQGEEIVAAQVTCWDISKYSTAPLQKEKYQEALERQRWEIAALYRISAASTSTLDLDGVIHIVYAQIRHLFTFSGCAFVLYEAERDELVPVLITQDGQPIIKECWSLSHDDGPIGWTIRHEKPLVVRDWTQECKQWPSTQHPIVMETTRSWLSVPLLVQKRLLGIVCLQSKEIGAFGESERRTLRAIADQAAMVLENVRLYQQAEQQLEELQQANREMQALQDLSAMLQSSLDIRNVYQVIVNGLVEGLGYGIALLSVIDEKEESLVVRALDTTLPEKDKQQTVSGTFGQEVRIPLEQKKNIGVRALGEGRILLTNFLYDLFRPVDTPDIVDEIQQLLHVQTIVVVPLFARGKRVGCLFAGSHHSEISGREIALLSAFANQSAIAIENAHLYSTVNQRLIEVSTLYTLANQISHSLDLDIVLDSIVNTLRRVLDCRSSCIFLIDPETEWLEIKASSGIKPRWQRDARMHLGEGISGLVAKEARSRYIPDTYLDPDFITFDPTVRSLLVVPLMVSGRVIGTLSVDDNKPDAFSTDEGLLLSITAAQAAVAIDNARLFEDLKERAEKLEKAYAELQEASRLKSEFVQNVSHELRTPLTFIKAYVDLLLAGTLGPLTEKQHEKFEIVSERTSTIVRLIDDIFSLQQIEYGNLNLAAVSLEKVARVSMQSAEVSAAQGGLTLIEDFEPGLRPVWGDELRLHQVFDNLIGNAIKFSPSGGTITVRLRNDEHGVCAEIIDQGIGIPEDKQGKIFERFYQVDGSTKRQFGGTGLGLAIVKEIVEAHGETVSVESQVDVGSTMRFRIPYAPSETN